MIKNYTKALLLCSILITILILGCKRESVLDNPIDPILPPSTTITMVNDLTQVTASVSGIVLDESNVPIASAVVTSGAAATTTNSNGMFIFQNISLSKENGSVTVVKAGYFKGVRSFKTTAGKNHTVRLQLMQKVLSGTVSAAAGGTINSNGGASIIFPATAFVTSTGAAYMGTVNVYSRWINPTAANLSFIIPGDLRGVGTNGAENILETYGMVGAELEDASGNTLKIATGKKATISFPLPASLQASAPATIQLWHFDDATARWKENGTATKAGSTYTAQVDKFSFWNCDVSIANFILLDYTLINATTNTPLASTLTRIKAVFGRINYELTNNEGFVSQLVPKNEALVLEVISPCNSVIYSQNIGPFLSNSSLGNININLPISEYKNFTGRLINCIGSPVNSGFISFYANTGIGIYANTNATGNFAFSLLNCVAGNLSFNYTGVDNATSTGSVVVNGSSSNGNANINLGNITVCNLPSNADIYAVGAEEVAFNINQAKFWKNGIATNLTDGTRWAIASSIFISGTDVYVVGTEQNPAGKMIAKIWKNGIVSNLINSSVYDNYATSVCVAGNDIYVSGNENNISGTHYRAKYWKNGVENYLTDGMYEATASKILTIGMDIYVVGMERNNSGRKIAKVWKNGIPNNLTNGNSFSEGRSMFLLGTDIYTSGWEATSQGIYTAKIWKNGIETNLTNGNNTAVAQSIFVSGTDVYAAGWESLGNGNAGNYVAKFWKNGIVTNLTNGNTFADASSIYIFNGNVFIGGRERSITTGQLVAKIWKNGVSTNLTDGTKNAYLNSIFIQ